MNTAWMQRAKCKDRTDIDFFPEKGHYPHEAVALCEGCPVRRSCFDYAIEHGLDDGVWGGVTSNRRNLYRRGRIS